MAVLSTMRRRLRSVLALISTVAFMAVAALWLRSFAGMPRLVQWSRQPEGQKNPFVVERVRGVFAHQGEIVFVTAADSVLQSAYFIERRQSPTFMRTRGAISDPAVEWPVRRLGDRETDLIAFAGFACGHYITWSSSAGLPTTTVKYLSVPCWFLLVVSAALPARWLFIRMRGRRRATRTAQHLCPDCGYDVRATPDRCPECGKDLKPELPPINPASTGGAAERSQPLD
jgi:hypothetical protein